MSGISGNKNKFSIILPVKNGGDYVKECVGSILAQSYRGFNLHILENCSTDGTAEWLQTLKDERIIIYPAERPLRIEENWGRIISIPRNEFMTMIGHDDLLDKNYLEAMDELIRKFPDASLYQTHFRYINGKGKFIRKCRPMQEKQDVAGFLEDLLTNSIDTMGTGYMMKSKCYNLLSGIQPYPNLLFSDHRLWIELTAINYKATAASDHFSYRLHENFSKTSGSANYIHAFYKFMDFLNQFKANDLSVNLVIKKYILEYIRYYCRSLAHRLLRTPESQRENITIRDFISECIKYATLLNPSEALSPLKEFNIRLAESIDNNIISRKLYVLFRKFYRKPIYS